MGILIFIILILGLLVIKSILDEKARKDRIYKKYGHTDVAEKIINKIIWVGQTIEQLLDSIGKPVDTDESVLKTKRKEVWKYYQKSATRFGLRIKVEDGVVIGWDEKL